MKVLKYIFNTVIWTLLGLYLLFLLTFQIPSVQEYAAQRLAHGLSKKLGTSVHISKAEMGIPNHLTLYDVLIRDQQGHEMLKANRLSARFQWLPLAEGKLSFATAQIFGAQAAFSQKDANSKPNYQFALDSLTSKDSTSQSSIDLRINSLIMRKSSFSYDRYDIAETPGILNPQHIGISDISAHIILKAFNEDSLNVNFKRLSFKEKSGMQVDRFSMHFEGGPTSIKLHDFLLRMPGTEVKLGDVKTAFHLHGRKIDIASLVYEGSILPSTITLSDLSCLLPSLKTFNSTLTCSSTFRGEGHNITFPTLLIGSSTGDINIDVAGWMNNIGQAKPTWQVDVNDLELSDKTLNFISENLQGRQVEIPAVVNRMGSIHLTGHLKGEGLQRLSANTQLTTEAGLVDMELLSDPEHNFSGKVKAMDVNLGQLLDNPMFGFLAADVNLSGQWIPNGKTTLQAEGSISQFDYNGYEFQEIRFDGAYSPSDIQAHVNMDDPNLKFVIDGNVERLGATNHIRLTADVNHFSPQAIHLTDKWGHSVFAAELSADVSMRNISDMTGVIDINDLTMSGNEGNYHMKQLHLISESEGNHRSISLESDFAHAKVEGNFSIETLPASITSLLAAKLPTLPGISINKTMPHNDLSLHVTINKSDWIEKLLQMPVRLTQAVTLQGSLNDGSQQINVEGSIPQFYYKDSRYDNGRLNITSPLGTLLCDLSVTKLMDDGKKMDLQLTGSAYDNRMSASLLWDNNSTDRMQGKLTAMCLFDTTLDGKNRADIQIAPSHMNMKDTNWDILPSHITYYDHHLDIDNLSMCHEQQFLTLKGTASERSSDSLSINMRDVDIAYILNLVNFHAVEFSGLATGKGYVSGLFGNMKADADLKVKNFKFENGRMGTLNAQATWNTETKRIDIHGICDDGEEAMTYINGFVDPSSPGFIDLAIDAKGTYLDFAHSFTESFISHIDGHADGSLRLIGPLDAINLTGQLVLNGSAHVKTLGCTYEMRNDTLKLIPNEIIFAQCPIYDIHGHEGILTGGIHHKELTQLTYDIFVDSNNLMAYDFPDFGDELFYGTVFVQGHAAIHGRPNDVLIEADVTPLKGSVFVYNAASPDIITNREFIIWNAPVHQESNSMTAPSDYRSDLTMQLKINATPDAAIRLLMDAATSDYITLHGNGDLQATYYNKGGFNMFGTYEVSSGTYEVTIQEIIKKNFTFREGGTIVFAGDPYDAQLELQAQNIVNGVSLSDLNVGRSFSNTVRVNCLMNITGQPRAPQVDFDLDILNVNTDEKEMVRSVINGQEEMRQQVIYLLAVGRFYPQGANNATESEQARNSTSLAMQSLLSGTLSGQINSMLNSVIKSNNWNFGANISTGDEGWNNAEYEGIINGRLLNNRLLINGQFGYRDNATSATPSFIGDFDIQYLLYPSGNLALKVYNQTNDRYFTRSSLNTQGIGIIMKKDFNGWRDLIWREEKKLPLRQIRQAETNEQPSRKTEDGN